MDQKQAESLVLAALDPQRVVALEKTMVQIPSPTWEEDKLALFLAQYMREAGLEVELQAVPIGIDRVGVQPIGRLRGEGGGESLLLSGHMDYLGLEDVQRWKHHPFSADDEDGYIYGRGTKDEKGGICAAVAAAEAIARSGVRLKGDLVVVPVMGHKTKTVGGGIGARHLMESGLRTDVAIVTENSNLGIATVCVGRITAQVHFEGVPGSFDLGPGSDLWGCLMRVIDQIGPQYVPIEKGRWLTFTPHPDFPGFPKVVYGDITTGKRRTSLSFNVRIIPGMTPESVRQDIDRVIARAVAADPSVRTAVEIAYPIRYPHQISNDDPLVVAICDAFHTVRGELPEAGLGPRNGAVADSWFFIGAGLTRTTVFGPGSLGPDFPDLPDERIAIRDLVDCARVYALTALKICAVG